MITTNLTGNLGNHMWQYAVCRTIAEHKGYEWGINSSPSHDYHKGMNQMYFMDVDFGKPVTGIAHEYHEPWKIYQQGGDAVNITMLNKSLYDIMDNTIMLGDKGAAGGIYQSEDYILHKRDEVLEWFKIKDEYKKEYDTKLAEAGFTLDENLCVINFRGGEYKLPKLMRDVMARKEYWADAINHMKERNSEMKFLIISDDPNFAKTYMPFDIPAMHLDIGFDFYVVNQAKSVILSNSSFGWWCGWLNTNANLIIAPKYWARHNVSDGYWATGDMYTTTFSYLDREGNLQDYKTCKEEAINYYKEKGLI